jgi:hypothetical protein
MTLANTYWLDCDQDQVFNATGCTTFEYGKVRSAALIKKSYLQTVLANPTEESIWMNGINDQKIILMPYVSGSFDPGEPVLLKGYGRRLATRGPRDMTLTFNDGNYLLNYLFYSAIQRNVHYVPAFRTGSVIHIGHSTADIIAKNTVEEDIESQVVWEIKARWRNFELPHAFDSAGLENIFNFDRNASQKVVLNFASGRSFLVPLKLIIKFRVGEPGAPMTVNDTTYVNNAFANKNLLILASGLGVPVDDGSGSISFDPLERRVENTFASNTTEWIGGVAPGELIEIYGYEN